MSKLPQPGHERYHAHVYFDADSVAAARALCAAAWHTCHVALGRFHEKEVGPHPRWSCQISFDGTEFDAVVAWLEANREGLSVLVHPLGDDALAEHTTLAGWLGEEVPLRLEVFEQSD